MVTLGRSLFTRDLLMFNYNLLATDNGWRSRVLGTELELNIIYLQRRGEVGRDKDTQPLSSALTKGGGHSPAGVT